MRLAILLAAAGLMLAVPAAADENDKPTDPCVEEKELQQAILDLAAQIQEEVTEAKPICARRKQSHWAADECAKRQIQIESDMAALKQLNTDRKVAKAACEKSKP